MTTLHTLDGIIQTTPAQFLIEFDKFSARLEEFIAKDGKSLGQDEEAKYREFSAFVSELLEDFNTHPEFEKQTDFNKEIQMIGIIQGKMESDRKTIEARNAHLPRKLPYVKK